MASKSLNPRTTHYEFLGPPGATFIILVVPLTAYALYFLCTAEACPPTLSALNFSPTGTWSTDALIGLRNAVFAKLSDATWWSELKLWDNSAAFTYLAWYAYIILAWYIIPGDWVNGKTLRNGEHIKYKINAFPTLLLTLGLVGGYIARFGPESFTFLYEQWPAYLTASVAMAVFQAVVCYLASFRNGALLALGGNTGNIIYDFFIGRELNPPFPLRFPFSTFHLDLKQVNELRPGLILWFLVDISCACAQHVKLSALTNSTEKVALGITDSMWLVVAFQGWYIIDAAYNEPAILSTMDIVTDGFGYMLAAGDLAWVPFAYSLQARYLAFHPIALGHVWTAAIVTVNALGYYIFRTANGQKDDFRAGRPTKLKSMQTASGTKLITSGMWGASRHPNYMGDLIMALAWSLPTGFETPITYFYVVYFTVLLVHRQRRDDEACEKKYGEDWNVYKKLVPSRIFPYIY